MAKNIALFIDGTWNDDLHAPFTNVQKLFARAELASPSKQVCHYMRGIGTAKCRDAIVPDWLIRANIVLKNKAWYVRLADKALAANNVISRRLNVYAGGLFGYGMSRRIMEAYAFLVEHFEQQPRSRIYIFGFSRGAYAARSLACFIDKVGLLLKKYPDKVEEAYAIYESGGHEAPDRLNAFLMHVTGSGTIQNGDDRNALPVYLLGVWDTVRELGGPSWLQKISVFDTKYHRHAVPSNVSNVRHALALHELRKRFEPVLFGKCELWQSLKQVWFAGSHADIGGGYADSTLSDIALEWMAYEAQTLQLDVAACPSVAARKNCSRSVHNVISGRFILFNPTVRRFLRDPFVFLSRARLAHHYLHVSALHRLDGADIKYDFFEDAANAALRTVDDCTWNVYLVPTWVRRAKGCVHADPWLCSD